MLAREKAPGMTQYESGIGRAGSWSGIASGGAFIAQIIRTGSRVATRMRPRRPRGRLRPGIELCQTVPAAARVRPAPDEFTENQRIGGTLSVLKQLTARKSVAAINQEIESAPRLNRVLGPVTLTSVGLGAMIGTGIFVLTGTVAAQHTGPAITIAFLVAAIGCGLAALCYAELASMIPISRQRLQLHLRDAGRRRRVVRRLEPRARIPDVRFGGRRELVRLRRQSARPRSA